MTADSVSYTETVGQLDDMEVGTMKAAKVGDRRVVLVRTADGVHALDNACPHQGYGLATGALDGSLLTCQWHNWKFDVATGQCVMGEEDVACHQVDVVDGEVSVTVSVPSADTQREQLWPSFRSALEKDYIGQTARDSLRLLSLGATPAEIMWKAVEYGAPRHEWGIGHDVAGAADCLQIASIEALSRETQAHALVQGLSGLAETSFGYEPVPLPSAAAGDVTALIEAEDVQGAMGAARALGESDSTLEAKFAPIIDAVAAHLYDGGHAAIFTQKVFELLKMCGEEHASFLLPYLAETVATGTRGDTLPYMRKAMDEIAEIDLAALVATEPAGDRRSADALSKSIGSAFESPVTVAANAAIGGLGVSGMLNAASVAAADLMLRHNLEIELDLDEPVRWLTLTHALTYTRAARWAWETNPNEATAQQALFAVWRVFDAGRGERRNGVQQRQMPEHVMSPKELLEAAVVDRAGSWIMQVHLIKTSVAAIEEFEATGSPKLLAAATRLLESPRMDRFVSDAAKEAMDFIATGRPPKR